MSFIMRIITMFRKIKKEENMETEAKKGKKHKSETFLQGVMILIFSQVLIKILGLVQTLYLTNREGFGDAGNAIYMGSYQIYALLLSVSSIGIPNAISKLVSERLAVGDNRAAHRILRVSLLTFGAIGLAGTLLLLIGAGFISNVILSIPESKVTLMILSPGVFFVALSSVFRGYFGGLKQMKATANSQSFEQFWKTALTIVFVEIIVLIAGLNTTAMAAAATAATSSAIVISFVYLNMFYRTEKKYISIRNKPGIKGERKTAKQLVKLVLWISIPISLTAILSTLNKLVDSTTMVKILKPIFGEELAKEKYGILSAKVDVLTSLPLAFNVAFATALVPAISAANAIKDNKTINERISFSLLVSLLIGLPCTVGMMIYSEEILQLLFPRASNGAVLLAISSLTIIFTILAQTINGILQGFGKVRVPAIALGIGVLVKIIANLVLMPIPGIYENGAAWGSVFCHLISFIIVYFVLTRTAKLDFSLFRLAIRPALATVIMAIISYASYIATKLFMPDKIATVIAIFIAVIVYAIAIIALKIFKKEEILMLPKGDKILAILKKIHVYD